MAKTSTRPKRRRKGKRDAFWKRYLRALRFYLVTGLTVWVPLIVTAWLGWWLYKTVGLGLENTIENLYSHLNDLGGKYHRVGFLTQLQYTRGTGFGIAIALFLTTGILTRYLAGRKLITTTERVVDRIPFVSRIYRAVQQIRDVFVTRDGAVFQQVCVIEYPRRGIYAVGFITSQEHGVVQVATDKKLIAVFIPTTPNPTSGFLLYLHREEITPLDITTEEAMKLIISGGAYIPGLKSRGEEKKPFELTKPPAHYEP